MARCALTTTLQKKSMKERKKSKSEKERSAIREFELKKNPKSESTFCKEEVSEVCIFPKHSGHVEIGTERRNTVLGNNG